jgi:hypothetical protein
MLRMGRRNAGRRSWRRPRNKQKYKKAMNIPPRMDG